MAQDTPLLEKPTVHLVHMLVFTLIVGILGAVLFPSLKTAFMANPGLNGLIFAVLLLGIVYAFRMVGRLFPEVTWVNSFRMGETSDLPTPVLLGPMSSLLGDGSGRTVLSPTTMRSLLDSLASRLDESRDLLRYLVGLLIFLGLLGTFYGLLDTVQSIGSAIQNLDVSAGQSSTVFEELKTGLQGPLKGMGISFSSSLFGLAGSLILGFMDLKASQAQNRFYHNFEDWLSTITDVQQGDGATTGTVPAYMRLDMQNLQRTVDKLGQQMDHNRPTATHAGVNGNGNDATMEQLADAVTNLVTQMREEQKMVRQWMQTQQTQQTEIQRTLLRQGSRRD
jgi:hypothetical protein